MTENPDPDKVTTIVEAARKRFGHYGLIKTTMHEIASDAGMSKASLYYYFPDKEHLFIEVIRREMETFFTEIKKVTSQSIPPAEQLKQYVDLRFICFQQFLNLAKLASTHFQAIKAAFVPLNDDFIAREKQIIQGILETGIERNLFEKIDAVMHADLFVSLLRSLRVMIIKQRDDFALTQEDYDSLKNYQTQFASIYIKGISLK